VIQPTGPAAGAAVDRALLVVNPIAGRGRAATLAPALVSELAARGISARTVLTAPEGGDDALDEAILGADAVIALGGDGTLNRVARPIVLRQRPDRPRPVVALVALGTGNVAARAFGLPRRPADVARLVSSGAVRLLDAGVVSRRGAVVGVFLLWLGAGLDGALIHAVAARRSTSRGSWLIPRYLLEGPRVLVTYPFPPVRVRSEHVDGDFATVLLANIGRLAVGSVTRRADPCDGQLDLIATRARSRLSWWVSGALVGVNAYDRCWGVRRSRERRVQLLADEPVPVHIDGEPFGTLPLEVEVRPAVLPLLTPGGSPQN
jgi:diacylglycerol kinase family enzyme